MDLTRNGIGVLAFFKMGTEWGKIRKMPGV
jgi:hypothetical protein